MADADENAERATRFVTQLAELVGALGAAGVRVLVLKGLPLAITSAGGIAARHAGDIDLLVDPDALAAAHRVMIGLGYRASTDQGDPLEGPHRRAVRWLQKDRAYFRSGDTPVELHWRLSRYALLSLGFDELWQHHNDVDLGIASVPAPGDVHTVLHVAVHGVNCRFYRLQWAVDAARVLDRDASVLRGADELARRHHAARALAVARRVTAELRPPLFHPESPTAKPDAGVERAVLTCWHAIYALDLPPWQIRRSRWYLTEGVNEMLRCVAADAVPATVSASGGALPITLGRSMIGRVGERLTRRGQ
jgi:hypothetical protein